MCSPFNTERANVAAPMIIRGDVPSWRSVFADLLRYRGLFYFLTWRDIKVRYKQTALGIVWAFLQPFAIALSLTLFLSRVVNMPQGALPYPVFAYSGMVIWQFFAQSLSEASNSLIANERLISKVYFPRLIIPLSSVLASLVDFAISLFVLVLALAYFRIPITSGILLFPLMVILTGIIASGVGFWLSAINVKYRDVRYTINFLIQFWFLASPVAYPSTVIPEHWRYWYQMNPMTGAIEGFRWSLGGGGRFPAVSLAISAAVSVLVFVGGAYYFRSTEDTLADFI